jgi:hypothetical protein
MSSRGALKLVLGLVLGLPVVQATLLWSARLLLAALGDESAVHVLDRVNLATGVAWLLSLIALVVVLGLRALDEGGEGPAEES